MDTFSVVGKPLPRLDATDKVAGETKYIKDMALPGMLHGKILRSPHAHARIVRLDTSKAEALPGVRAVITARDVPKTKFSFIQNLADKEILCSKVVRYVGDEIAAVAADDLRTAEKAIGLIEVEYEPLPGVFDPEEALKEGAPLVHPDKGTNLAWEGHKEFGDIEKGFAEADYIFEDRFVTSKQVHCCMETHGCIARIDRAGRLTVWVPTQAPHTVRQELARILEMPISKVRVVRTPTGGGFGQRLVTDMKEPIAAVLSMKTGRPVKIINTREEEFETARTKYPFVIYLKTGVKKNGRLVARQMKIVADNGAYCDKGPSMLNFVGVYFSVYNNVSNVKYDAYVAYTNRQFCTAFRGFGNPQMHFALESQMDKIAEKLDIDPYEIRLINANKKGDTSSSGAYVTSCGMIECLDWVAKASNWKEKRANLPLYVSPDGKKKRGIGIASMIHTGSGSRIYGYMATDTFIKVSEDGRVSVIAPAPEIGQGVQTVIGQIVAEVLGIPLDQVYVTGDDTDTMGYDLGCWGSRSTFVAGNSAKAAAEEVKKEILATAATMLDDIPEGLEARDGRIYVRSDPSRSVTFKDVVNYSYFSQGKPISGRGRFADPIAPEVGYDRGYGVHVAAFTFGSQAAEVEVDMETGQVKLLKLWAAIDSGRTINPMMASGQVEGSLVQGAGWALTEDYVERNGKMLNSSFAEYKVLSAVDIPETEVFLVESVDPNGPFGAKGMGEPGYVATTAAIANAIYHATGVRFYDIPMTSEKILKALKAKGQAPAAD